MHKIMIAKKGRALKFFEVEKANVLLQTDSSFNKKKGGVLQIVTQYKNEKDIYVLEKEDNAMVDGVPMETIYAFLGTDTELVKSLKSRISEYEKRVEELNGVIDELQDKPKLEVIDGDKKD